MKKIKLISLGLLLGFSSVTYAAKAVLICRTNGVALYDAKETFSLPCNNSTESACKSSLRSQVERKYGSLDAACSAALSTNYWADRIKIVY